MSAATRSLCPCSMDASSSRGIANAMTVDVEDYFQVEAFASTIDRKDWDNLPPRVERNTLRLLDIFAEAKVQATFFMLGWVAQQYPALIRRIVTDGHELASHGFGHRRVDSQSPDAFRADVRDAKQTLEDTGGVHLHSEDASSAGPAIHDQARRAVVKAQHGPNPIDVGHTHALALAVDVHHFPAAHPPDSVDGVSAIVQHMITRL